MATLLTQSSQKIEQQKIMPAYADTLRLKSGKPDSTRALLNVHINPIMVFLHAFSFSNYRSTVRTRTDGRARRVVRPINTAAR